MNLRQRVERDLREWLRGHHGIVGHAEALSLGASPSVIKSKLARGEWETVHRGVYRDTATAPGHYQDLRAAFVATAGLGVVSHASAAWVWGLLAVAPTGPELTVRLGTRDGRRIGGVVLHRSRDIDLRTAVERHTILVTNPLRTLVDLAGAVPPRQLTEAVDKALAARLVTTAGLEAEIARLARPGRTGVGALRRHLVERGFAGAPEPSVLEARIRRLIVTAGIPLPTVELNVFAEGSYRLDLAWAGLLLAVEVDGYAWHFSPEQKQRDQTRRNRLMQAGWTILVYSWNQVAQEPTVVLNEISAAYQRLALA